jgi:hypothetical protein
MVAPDSQATACLPSGRNSTYRPVQICGTGSTHQPIAVILLTFIRPILTLFPRAGCACSGLIDPSDSRHLRTCSMFMLRRECEGVGEQGKARRGSLELRSNRHSPPNASYIELEGYTPPGNPGRQHAKFRKVDLCPLGRIGKIVSGDFSSAIGRSLRS